MPPPPQLQAQAREGEAVKSSQQFQRGDLVRVAADLGPCMSHFRTNADAIVLGSYADQYGCRDKRTANQYTLLFTDSGSESSWYDADQLTLLRHVGDEGIREVESARQLRQKREADLDWIVANWPAIRHNPPGASVAALARLIGINDLWGPRGEGFDYMVNSMAVIKIFDEVLLTGDVAALTELRASK